MGETTATRPALEALAGALGEAGHGAWIVGASNNELVMLRLSQSRAAFVDDARA